MFKKYLAMAAATAAVVAVVPAAADAQEAVKPYEKAEIVKSVGKNYDIVVYNKTAPFVFKFSSGANAFFTNIDHLKDLNYPLDVYSVSELYVQLVSQDQKTVYDSFWFNTQTHEVIENYDISQFDYAKAGGLGHHDKIPFALGEVKMVDATTNEITFNEIKQDFMLYDFEKHAIIQIPASTEEVTYRIPSEIYLIIDPNTNEELGEFHLNKQDGYTLNPPTRTSYYYVDYKKRAAEPDATFTGVTPVKPKVIEPIAVQKNDSKSYFDKTAAQIAQEKYIDITKTGLKDVKPSSHRDAIVLLNKLGIINGYSDGTFKPSKTLRRSDIIKLTGRYAQVSTLPAESITAELQTKYGTKDQELISYREQLQGVYGDANNYNKDVTRGEFAVILANLIEHVATERVGAPVDLNAFIEQKGFESDYVVKNAVYKEAVTVLHYFGITNIASGQFNDDQTLTRAQIASFLTRIYAINFEHLK